jgi:hypothetical protein
LKYHAVVCEVDMIDDDDDDDDDDDIYIKVHYIKVDIV